MPPRKKKKTYATTSYHSVTLDEKVADHGYRYGSVQAQETLDMVGRVDVEAILAELKRNDQKQKPVEVPKPKPKPKLKPKPAVRLLGAHEKECVYCGRRFQKKGGRKYCSEWCKANAQLDRLFGRLNPRIVKS